MKTTPVKQVLSLINDNEHRPEREPVFESLFDEMAASSSGRPWLFEKPLVKSMEWEAFASFDPISTRSPSSSSIYSASSDGSRRNSHPRVHFVETGPNEKDVLRTEYKSTVDYDHIRSQWFTVTEFRSFRKACQEAAARASRDTVYSKHFFDAYASCFNNQEPSLHKLDFSDYRGLERAIFRQPLITDKIAGIKGVVRSQMVVADDEELGDISRRYTSTACKLARALAKLDRLVVDQPASPQSMRRPRRFIEI